MRELGQKFGLTGSEVHAVVHGRVYRDVALSDDELALRINLHLAELLAADLPVVS